jgi:hypothetical protein
MVLTQVVMLEKEKAIRVSVERRASEEVASLSKCVHQLQVDIFSHVEYVCQFRSFLAEMCAHARQLNGMLYAFV